MLQERNNYAIIGYKYIEFLESLVDENIRFILEDGPVSVETFQSNVEQLSNDSNYIDWLLFDVSYINQNDYTEAIRYLKTICNQHMKIMVIDPLHLNKKTAKKLVSYGVFDIVTLLGVNNINVDNDEEVLNELQFQIEQLDLNPRDFAEGQYFLDSLPEEALFEEETEPKKGFSLFINNKKNKPQKTEKKTKKTKLFKNSKKYTVSCITYDEEFKEQLIKECEESPFFKYETVNSRIIPEYIDILIFDGNFDESDIAEYEIADNTKLFVFRNDYLEDEYEEIIFASYHQGDRILPYLTNEDISSNVIPQDIQVSKKEKKRINILFLIVPLLIITLISAILFTPLKNIFNIFEKKPSITLLQETIEIGYKEDFNSEQYISLSNMSDEYNLKIINDVKQHEIGEYNVNYQIIDINNNILDNKFLKVKIVDNIQPNLTLEKDKIELEKLDNFDCKAYIKEAQDEIDGDLTHNVVCSNNLKEVETQSISYSVEDKSGNRAETEMTIIYKNYKKDSDKPTPTPSSTPSPTPTPTPTPVSTPSPTPTPEPTSSVDNNVEIEIMPMELKVGASKADIENATRKAIVKTGGSGNVTISIDYSKVDTTKAGKYEVDYILIYENDEQLIKKGTLTVTD